MHLQGVNKKHKINVNYFHISNYQKRNTETKQKGTDIQK